VHLFRKEGRLFIGGRGSTGGVQWRPAHRACRLWEGQGVALARSGHVQRYWGDVGDVMARQGDEGEREEQWPEVGGPGCSPPFFRVSRPGSGQGRQGIDKGESRALWEGHGHVRGVSPLLANIGFDLV
jgi:hypothetical protein